MRPSPILTLLSTTALLFGCSGVLNYETPPKKPTTTHTRGSPHPTPVDVKPLVERLDPQIAPVEVWRRAGAALALLNYRIRAWDESLGLIDTHEGGLVAIPCEYGGKSMTCDGIQVAVIVVQPGYLMVRINRAIRPTGTSVRFEPPRSEFDIAAVGTAQRELRDLIISAPDPDKPPPSTPFDGLPVADSNE